MKTKISILSMAFLLGACTKPITNSEYAKYLKVTPTHILLDVAHPPVLSDQTFEKMNNSFQKICDNTDFDSKKIESYPHFEKEDFYKLSKTFQMLKKQKVVQLTPLKKKEEKDFSAVEKSRPGFKIANHSLKIKFLIEDTKEISQDESLEFQLEGNFAEVAKKEGQTKVLKFNLVEEEAENAEATEEATKEAKTTEEKASPIKREYEENFTLYGSCVNEDCSKWLLSLGYLNSPIKYYMLHLNIKEVVVEAPKEVVENAETSEEASENVEEAETAKEAPKPKTEKVLTVLISEVNQDLNLLATYINKGEELTPTFSCSKTN